MRKFGLIGYPLGHSFSQKYFAEKFVAEQITDCSYENFPMKDLNVFPELITGNSGLCGLNVTIPHKTAILHYIDVMDPAVVEIGASNVLKIKRSAGRTLIYGFNSDITGIRDSVLPYLHSGLKNALIIGTGGSSKAVCYVLKNLGLNVNLVSRVRKPGILNYNDVNSGILKNAGLIVNTTPLGMFPDISGKPDINYDQLNENHVLFDLVYNPEMTAFLKMGQERGCKIITGLKMLYSQAERSWEIWNDDNY